MALGERHLTLVLMESLLKLASLTSTRVFLLVEDRVGRRRIAGSQQLSQAFKGGALVPTGDEVEMLLDDVAPAIYEKPAAFPRQPADLRPFESQRASPEDGRMGHSTALASPLYDSASSVDSIQRLNRKRLSDGFNVGASKRKNFKRAHKPNAPAPSISEVEVKHETFDDDCLKIEPPASSPSIRTVT